MFEQAIDLEYAVGRINESVKVLLTSSNQNDMIYKSNKIFEEDRRSSQSEKSYNSNTRHRTNTVDNSRNNHQQNSDFDSNNTKSENGNKSLIKSETINDGEFDIHIEDNQSINSKSNLNQK